MRPRRPAGFTARFVGRRRSRASRASTLRAPVAGGRASAGPTTGLLPSSLDARLRPASARVNRAQAAARAG